MITHPFSSFLRRSLVPGVEGFALLGGAEAVVRGMVLSAFPLLMYRAYGDAALVSRFYFGVGTGSLFAVMMAPQLIRYLPRMWVYSGGVSLYLVGALLGMVGGRLIGAALLCNAMAAAITFVCFNAYVLDYVGKAQFSRMESLRLLCGGIGWTVGPFLGVWLLQFWSGAPFVVTGVFAALMLVLFWRMNPGEGRVIHRAKRASANPLVFLRRFFSQPRLVAGWLFTLIRSCGWWVYFVYVGIYAVESGLPDTVGGLTTSLANLGLFLAPLMLRWVLKRPVRDALRFGFLTSGIAFILAAGFSPLPWLTIGTLLVGSFSLVLLDICAGLPFLMSVKPSQRTEMSAVYSSFRDVSGIVSPGIAWLVLKVAPVPAIFAVTGLGLLIAWAIASQLHPRLGQKRGAPCQTMASDT